MINILLFSLIVGLATALVLIPFSRRHLLRIKNETGQKIGKMFPLVFIILIIIGVFAFYYVTNLDRNFSSLWVLAIPITAIGTLLSTGKERWIKGILFLGSLVIGAIFMSAYLFNADEKHDIAKMKEKVEIETFDEKETPASVPPKFARNKMKKAFGQVPNTSYYELGHLQIQKVDGNYVYIAPVEFSGFFKWFNGHSTPGYFMVSATDSTANPKFMKAEMSYTPSSFFHKKLERHMRMHYPQHIFYGDVQLEIDDDGRPFYIRSYGKFISARNGFDVEGIVMVDPKSGKTMDFPLKDVPAFIDGAVSPEVVSLQNSYFGNYVHGYWNSVFGKKDVKLPSDEGTEANVSPIFDENGDMYYFTDFTSPKAEVDSMLGYSLTNSRTGEATYYTGNLEESYMDSQGALQIIEKKFIEKKWNGQMPIIYNFYGEASWLTPVLDSNGFLQNYFIVSAANPEISAFGDTPNEALKLYKNALQKGGGTVNGTSKAEEKQTTGNVLRVYKEKTGDVSLIYFLLEDKNSYVVSADSQPLAIYLQEGDAVEVKYSDTGEPTLPVKELKINALE